MISLKEALSLPKSEIEELKKDLTQKAKESSLNAIIGYEEGGEGIPILIKDNISVKDWNITCASKILKNYVAPYNATVINNLQDKGFSPFHRSNMDEFAMGSSTENSCYGKTLNPYNVNCVPGGSSGGSAAAVAGGLAIAALGSDTGGSIRQPAAFCGIVGLKPTYGRVSRYGLVAYGSSLDQIGTFARSVEDTAILYDAIAGFDPKDSTSRHHEHVPTYPHLDGNKKFRIAVIENYINEASEPIRTRLWDMVNELEKAGHTIVRRHLLNAKYDIATYYITATAEASTNLQRFDGIRYGQRSSEGTNLSDLYIKTRSEGFGEEVKRRILLGNFVLSSGYYDAYYVKAQKVRELIRHEYNEIFKEADVMLLPVTPTTAFEFGSKKDPLEMYLEDVYTISLNLAGLPGISVPIGFDDKGLPIGCQLISGAFCEQTLLDAALSIETVASFTPKF